MFECVILMAGSGTRAKLGTNKVFYQINQKALFEYSLNQFLSIEACSRVVLVIQPEDEKYLQHLIHPKIVVTYGGSTRQDSVYLGVLACNGPLVFIHDGARANIQRKDILKLYEVAQGASTSLLATKAQNTIKQVQNGVVQQHLDRNALWEAQTPQAIQKEQFEFAYRQARDEGFVATDDVSLIQRYCGGEVVVVEGDPSNIKATTPIDFIIMKELLKED